MDPDQKSDLGPHCLPVCKNRFEKFAKIFSRRHKQTTFSDAGFLDALRVNFGWKMSGVFIHQKMFECNSLPNSKIEKSI